MKRQKPWEENVCLIFIVLFIVCNLGLPNKVLSVESPRDQNPETETVTKTVNTNQYKVNGLILTIATRYWSTDAINTFSTSLVI